MMTDVQYLLFVRHGETVGNLEEIAHGQTESPLNERGQQQAAMTAAMLTTWNRSFDQIYCSPLSRARDTAHSIAEALSLPVVEHSDLMEGNLCILEEVTYKELDDFGFAKRSIRDDDFREHQGESPNMLGNRVSNAVSELRGRHPGQNIICVSHGAAIAHAMAKILDTRPAFGHQYLMHNAAVTEIRFAAGKAPEVTTLNYHDHLPNDLKVDPTRRDQHVRE